MNIKSKKSLVFTISIVIVLLFASILALSIEQIDKINGNFISKECASLKNIQLNSAINVSNENNNYNFKLFGIIPIGKAQENKTEKYVMLGGYPIGIAIKTNGLYITSKVSVVTKDGAVCPVEDFDIKSGDILLEIDSQVVKSVNDIPAIIQDKIEVTLKIKRNEDIKEFIVQPALDALSGKNKLGLLLQDQIEGIGTMTYTDGKNFYALGHTIKDMNGENVIANGGNIYTANINGYVRGQKGRAGELNGTFMTLDKALGNISANNDFGLYGQLENEYQGNQVLLGSKSDVQPGTAYIYTTINGMEPQKYEIQIIKANNQNSPSEKSMVLRVVDKRLLDTTGGIVQGMSGSPIIQNGKLIGAVTHVFTSDPTKGYGVYVDWMKP
ncbi:MAG: SpoIVB peptidase [Clostridia bacterium]|nr:SpoIVB peptidase [Clostridia bacterium]